MVLLLRFSFWAFHLHAAVHLTGTVGELHVSAAAEGLQPTSPHVLQGLMAAIETCQQIEVHLVFQEVGRVLPSADASLVFPLLVDNANGVDALVHADGVLPVVGTLGELGVILDAHGLVRSHVLQHHGLLHASYLCTGGVLRVTHLLYTIAGEITLRAARIAHGHGEITFLISLQGHFRPPLRLVRHVVLGISRGAIGLGIGVDAEHGEVASLARPHPVVGLSSKLTHRLGHGEDQPQVGEVLVSGGVPFVALIESVNSHVQGAVLYFHLLGHDLLQGIYQLGLALGRESLIP